jgi:hypothetical protein
MLDGLMSRGCCNLGNAESVRPIVAVPSLRGVRDCRIRCGMAKRLTRREEEKERGDNKG